uniref:Uncharacterized protein n=1 Tax=Odontella aurita TaxID=265563 RepID=A0A7S4MJ22_9STRA|mmetsp:Transcript_2298/g.6063  ORF Transcript_2298/g.6063 Transcript_2298/m.6063 type:complete len:207 (+) Transcript_2298:3-623(+)
MGGGSNVGMGMGMNSMQRSSGGLSGGMDGNLFGDDPLMIPQQGMGQGDNGSMGGLSGDAFDMQGSRQSNADMANILQGFQEQSDERHRPSVSGEQSRVSQGGQENIAASNADTSASSRQHGICPKQESLSNGLGGQSNSGATSEQNDSDFDPQERLRRIKEEIAQREREAEELLAATSEGSGMKRKGDDDSEPNNGAKRVKQEPSL